MIIIIITNKTHYMDIMVILSSHHYLFYEPARPLITVEITDSDHGYSDQPLIWIKKLGTDSFPYKCCLNNWLIVTK